jgi:transaldolase
LEEILRMNNIQKITQLGQSIWYDNISRSLLQRGELASMVQEGLLGVTSNPTIFDKAISGSSDYDGQIAGLVRTRRDISTAEMIQTLMVRDIQTATDILLPVYERTHGADGYVSIEVTPSKARDTRATIEEVRHLWKWINRPNLMIKIPATDEGLVAIEQAISEGVNINVTLIFAVERYVQVAEAYIAGLERRVREGKPVERVASVASVFVSRIDTLVDELLETRASGMTDAQQAGTVKALCGKAAVANTKMVYQAFKQIFDTSRFGALKEKGARVQRPLWGSTSTKNSQYNDLLYVDTLIGPHTVNTVPPATYAAILDHSRPLPTVESRLEEAKALLRELARVGIDLPWVMKKLEDDGVAAFSKSFDGLYKNLEEKRRQVGAGPTSHS